MSKVYLVVDSDYDQHDIIAAYLDEDKAKDRLEEEKEKLVLWYGDRYHSRTITLEDVGLSD